MNLQYHLSILEISLHRLKKDTLRIELRINLRIKQKNEKYCIKLKKFQIMSVD